MSGSCRGRGGTSRQPSRPKVDPMSPVRIRPVGGAAGCVVMILLSVVLSVVLTVLLDTLLH